MVLFMRTAYRLTLHDAARLGRWLASHHTIDSADLAIAATVVLTGTELLTRNVRHFPMLAGLRAPY